MRMKRLLIACVIASLTGASTFAQGPAKLPDYKKEAVKGVDEMAKLAQEMVDSVFSFGELGFQEVETSRYLTGQLETFGFKIQRGVAGIPTAWVATYGSGKPVIALGSDIDGIPQSSQKPGVAYPDPIIAGAPGHGEGHNTGMPLNVVAAIAVKRIMERDKLPGTLMLWPGVAEELLATKAWYVREGVFKDVDVVLFTHVGNNLGVSWGGGGGNGMVSVEYTFEGGDQPNVVPRNASIWFYFRELDYDNIKRMWDIGNDMAQGASLMTNTKWSSRILGAAWPQHMNKVVAETMYENITTVGLPQWSEADQTLAKALQKELGNPRQEGLATRLQPIGAPNPDRQESTGGGSDDIGDVSWNVPTVTLRFPSNIPGLPGHNWSSAIASATPIAHKGVVAGAKVQAMTVLDLMTRPELIKGAWDYFNNVQTKDVKYIPFIAKDTPPAIHLNKNTLEKYRDQMRKYYYDPTKFPTYLDQLGIKYPTVRPTTSSQQQ